MAQAWPLATETRL